jgi:hypothetical protein
MLAGDGHGEVFDGKAVFSTAGRLINIPPLYSVADPDAFDAIVERIVDTCGTKERSSLADRIAGRVATMSLVRRHASQPQGLD